MAEVKWIKIRVDIFDDEKILLIESLPEADTIITIWFKLLCLAGKQNNSGIFTLNDKIAYTDTMLATIFRRKESSVKLALATFQKFGMIEVVDNIITIPNWEKHQSLDAYEKKKEYNREFMRKKRLELKEKVVLSGATCGTTVVTLDKEEDKEIDINNNILSISDDEKGVFYLWNKLNFVKHRELTEQILSQIRKSLSLYGKNKIFEAMLNYSKVYHDESYFFKYKWSLIEFLKQANAMPEFFNDGVKYLNYCNRKTNKSIKETDSWVDERISNVESDFKEL